MLKEPSGWPSFLKLANKVGETDVADEFYSFLFTDDEKEQISKRIELTKALLEGKKSQRDISKDLLVSISKITRGSNGLKHISPELKNFFVKNLDI